jgi:hypothetical protein
MGPKVVAILTGGKKLFWCPIKDHQILEEVCKMKYFKRSSRGCRLCLGIRKGQHIPEPWADLGR